MGPGTQLSPRPTTTSYTQVVLFALKGTAEEDQGGILRIRGSAAVPQTSNPRKPPAKMCENTQHHDVGNTKLPNTDLLK